MLERRYEHLLNTAQAGVIGLAILLYCSQWRNFWLLDHAVGMFLAIMTAILSGRRALERCSPFQNLVMDSVEEAFKHE